MLIQFRDRGLRAVALGALEDAPLATPTIRLECGIILAAHTLQIGRMTASDCRVAACSTRGARPNHRAQQLTAAGRISSERKFGMRLPAPRRMPRALRREKAARTPTANGSFKRAGIFGDDRCPDAPPPSWPSLLPRIDAISR